MQNEVNISFLGDLCPINRVEKLILDKTYDGFSDLTQILAKQDLVIANLECPLTDTNRKIKKIGPNLKANTGSIDLIKHLNISIAALANNHILDFGQEGMSDTLSLLRENGVNYVGGGMNIKEAKKPLIIDKNGLKICFINVCEREFNIARENYAGANPNEIFNTIKAIEENKNLVDFVILIYHGGAEYYNLPTPNMQKCLRFYASIGVDLIIGHHSHIVSGYEIQYSTPIFYSLGNFIFDWKNKPDFWNESIIVNARLKKGSEISFEIIPLLQCKEEPGVRLLKGDLKINKIHQIKDLCSLIENESWINDEWKSFCKSQSKEIFAKIFSINKNHKRLMTRGIMPNVLLSDKKKLILFNQFFCESHRDVIFEILND